jgi:hypothetical protein
MPVWTEARKAFRDAGLTPGQLRWEGARATPLELWGLTFLLHMVPSEVPNRWILFGSGVVRADGRVAPFKLAGQWRPGVMSLYSGDDAAEFKDRVWSLNGDAGTGPCEDNCTKEYESCSGGCVFGCLSQGSDPNQIADCESSCEIGCLAGYGGCWFICQFDYCNPCGF